MSHSTPPSSTPSLLTRGLLSAALVGLAVVVGASSCSGPPTDLPEVRGPGPIQLSGPAADPSTAKTFALGINADMTSVSVPEHNRPTAGPPPEQIPLRGWRSRGKDASTKMPIRSRNLYFFKPSPGMRVLTKAGEEVPHKYYTRDAAIHWTYDAKTITLHGVDGPVADDDYVMVYPLATEREARLNKAYAAAALGVDGPVSDATFVRTQVTSGDETRSGLLLPAPAQATFLLDPVPPAADLSFEAALIPPEVLDAAPSDGARVEVLLTVDGVQTELYADTLKSDAFKDQRIPLDAYAGKQASLTITTKPLKNANFDYVFFADPVVASRNPEAKRVVLVFIDTLRFDHLGTYGHDRDTSPAIDALAAEGVRFDQARNVAPWTLPSTRSAVTGRHPEVYFSSDTLQGLFADQGWATAMFAGNLYLGPNFGLQRDWGLHKVELLPPANRQIDRALAWLDDHAGRDSLMLVHLMDPHLPYKEPSDYRNLYAKERPANLKRDSFHRAEVVRARLKEGEERQYIRDRYDQNIRYTDDQLSRLFDALRPDDIVVLFSDHGEEFWDHGGFEHGHALWDELLHVPLIVRAPGIDPTVVAEPVSLLDIVPTVLELAGLPPAGPFDGQSLVPAMQGDASARQALQSRDQAFGRPLYGKERWGVLHGDTKYMTSDGRQTAFDLGEDPGEKKDILKGNMGKAPDMRGWLSSALGRDVRVALRVSNGTARNPPARDLLGTLTVPGGVRAAWVGEDPTRSSAATVTTSGEQVKVVWPKGFRGSRDVWVIPNEGAEAASAVITLKAELGPPAASTPADKRKMPPTVAGPRTREVELSNGRNRVLSTDIDGRAITVSLAITPLQDADGESLDATDPEMTQALQAMGYLTDDEAEDEAPTPEP